MLASSTLAQCPSERDTGRGREQQGQPKLAYACHTTGASPTQEALGPALDCSGSPSLSLSQLPLSALCAVERGGEEAQRAGKEKSECTDIN